MFIYQCCKMDFKEIKNNIEKKLDQLHYDLFEVEKDEIIFMQGDEVKSLGLLTHGLLKCTRYTNDGNEITPHYFYKGEMFPEYMLLTGEKQYIYTLVAEEKSTFKVFDYEDVKELLKADLDLSHLLMHYMAYRGLLAEKWTFCNSYVNARNKIAYMILEIYKLEEGSWYQFEDNQRIISTKIHLSRTSYNLELAKLEKEGIIEKYRSKIKLLDKERLAQYL